MLEPPLNMPLEISMEIYHHLFSFIRRRVLDKIKVCV